MPEDNQARYATILNSELNDYYTISCQCFYLLAWSIVDNCSDLYESWKVRLSISTVSFSEICSLHLMPAMHFLTSPPILLPWPVTSTMASSTASLAPLLSSLQLELNSGSW